MDEADLPPSNHTFEYKLEKDVRQVYRSIQRSLSAYKDEKKGPTYIAIQSPQGMSYLMTNAQRMSHYITQYLQGPTEWPILGVCPTKMKSPLFEYYCWFSAVTRIINILGFEPDVAKLAEAYM